MSTASAQLGFDDLLVSAEAANRAREFERETGHLPNTMDDALPFYRVLLRQHHAAMLAGDCDEALRLRAEADRLACRLNGGRTGIIAGPEAPGCVLMDRTAAASGTVPLWGQCGDFVFDHGGMKVRIEIEGLFGIGMGFTFWPGFSAHAVEYDRPFLSETGYRSFLGIRADPVPGLLPDEFALKVVAGYVEKELRGRLPAIAARYRH